MVYTFTHATTLSHPLPERRCAYAPHCIHVTCRRAHGTSSGLVYAHWLRSTSSARSHSHRSLHTLIPITADYLARKLAGRTLFLAHSSLPLHAHPLATRLYSCAYPTVAAFLYSTRYTFLTSAYKLVIILTAHRLVIVHISNVYIPTLFCLTVKLFSDSLQ